MSDFRVTTGQGGIPIPQEPEGGTQAPGIVPGGSTLVDSAKLLAEVIRLSQTAVGTPGVSNANGAPDIDGVTLNMSPEDMAAALQVLQGKTQEGQLKTAREGLNTSQRKLEEKNQQALNKINDWIKKCEDAEAKQKSAGIFGWLTKIFAFIAAAIAVVVAAVAAVASGGGATPLLALAVVGLVGATMSLASQISQECGGPALELGSLMSKLCSTILEACGVPKEQAERAGKMMSGLAALAMPAMLLVDPSIAGQAIGGFAELLGADAMTSAIISGVIGAVTAITIGIVMVVATGGASVGSAVDGISKTTLAAVKTGGVIVQGIASAVAGAATATQGGLGIAKAYDERDASNIQADKKVIDAVIAKLQQQMEEDREEIKKVLQEIMDGMNLVSQMINAAATNRSLITANLAGKSQTI